MVIEIEKMKINEIPALHIVQNKLKNDPLPTVVYYHGYNGEKESSLTIAYKIAEKGLRVMLPDGYLHGEREGTLSLAEKQLQFAEMIIQTSKELEQIKSFIDTQNWVKNDRFGIGGTSMGGMITYCALRQYEWIKAAVVLMGSPYVTKRIKRLVDDLADPEEKKLAEGKFSSLQAELMNIDLTNDIASLKERPLFIWHGDQDAVVPVSESRRFYAEVKDRYEQRDDVQYFEEKDRIHNISKLSIEKTAAWFKKHL